MISSNCFHLSSKDEGETVIVSLWRQGGGGGGGRGGREEEGKREMREREREEMREVKRRDHCNSKT